MPRRWPNPVSAPRNVSTGRDANRRLIGNLSRHGAGTSAYIVEVQGINALAEHFLNYALAFDSFAVQMLDVAADIGIEEAKAMVGWRGDKRFQDRSGATRDSINKSPGVIAKPNIGEWSVRYGPTTFYAPFLEYGTVHARPYPFMIPSGDMVEPIFLNAVISFINLLVTGGEGSASVTGSGGRIMNHPQIKGSFSSLRTMLYSSSKFLGDVAVFGGRGFIGPARNLMLVTSRALGDVSSIMNRTVSTRISNRLGGRVTGRIIGFGSSTLSYSRTYSAFPGGAGGHRVYQRVAGRFGVGGLGGSLGNVRGFLSGR